MIKHNFSFVDSCSPYTVTLSPGQYLFELWGASGGSTPDASGGKGAYVSGILSLRSKKVFYVFVGGQGQNGVKIASRTNASCNGGGSGGNPYSSSFYGGGSGGGSTDIRINRPIDSRIIVAAGGGGAGYRYKGGNAGELESDDAAGYPPIFSKGANQTNGYSKIEGEQGRSGENSGWGAEGNGGGGGGYYCGFSSQASGVNTNAPGAGGSSFISGYHNKLFPGFHFLKPMMIGGGKTMKDADNLASYKEGHTGNGLALITKIRDIKTINQNIINVHFFMFFIIFLLTYNK